ncbi:MULTISPECIES: thiamine pyrophosphate-binding protein [Streptomycetaceae]|uniref:Thiamine pyrophosphate protein TPP binding domain protein n=1 Tax=Streptantibioticus cattleyicolor (strain ATCC 35852 / DSM 46488 / JCM 4925 / NBRC 14057 / NRRL 8057) TaxID=1003195 RepID=F8K2X3_STREN|nr:MULTISPECIES: thiamine pyrophosphate-binding protein [Streptomycetaceae]AEW92458.1 thiamine pyrophosphate protein TPP binding domain protein [Streptantibioticus cattleyicolor NRRL 8057 = DSM 46488]MYS57265.1 thiamine pyrophosphate-binding protein [Streptomyces sp. SID5468]CCB72822.1 Thiamine pyrophosphate-requiring enzyme [Streptantibioticus cattleyicolor NRRL 8057 = DSM 46488]
MSARPGKAALFEQLAADGITHMFGNPGTVEQGFLDLADGSATRYVLTLHESVAVAMADGYARAGARPGLVQLHSGVGLGNAIGMLYQARRGGSPLVALAGEAGVRYDAMDAQMAADLVAMAEPVTKYATRVVHPASLLRVVRRAVKIAMTPPRGPVLVVLPADVLDQETEEPAVAAGVPSTRVVPEPDAIEWAADALLAGDRPLVLMGDGVAVSGAQRQLTEVAELLGAPVWGVNSSEVNFDTTHPLFAGNLGHMFGADSARVVADADPVLIVGTYVFPEVFPELAAPFRPGARIVHIDADAYEIGKNFPVGVGLAADPAPTLAALAGRLRARGREPRRGTRTPPENGTRTPPRADGQAAPRTMTDRFAAELAAQAPPGLAVFDEALTCSPALTRWLPPRVPGTYFQTRGGSLGVGIPGALGVKLARPELTVVGFTGDGGSMYTIQALWTAARYAIDAKFVVCDNGRYRLLDHNIERYWRDRAIEPHAYPDAFDLSRPRIRFTELAGSLGVPAVRVAEPEQVADAVRAMLGHRGPFLVDLVTD